MSTLLDNETVVLEALDFEVPCSVRADHGADVDVHCRSCRQGALFCTRHAEDVRASVERVLRKSPVGFVVCGTCYRAAFSFDELAEVLPL